MFCLQKKAEVFHLKVKKAKDNIALDSPFCWHFTLLVSPRSTKHALNKHQRDPALKGWHTCGMNWELRSDCPCAVQCQTWNPDCGNTFSWKILVSALNFSKFSIEQHQLRELQNINSNYIVGVWVKLSLPRCCRQTSIAAARGCITELASPHCSWCKNASAYSKHTGVLLQREEKRGGERGKKPGGSYKLTASSHDLNLHPDVHDWTQTQAELAPWARKEEVGFVL